MKFILLIGILLLTGCAQLPPLPGDAAAKKFEAVPDRAVIYVARHTFDRRFVAPIKIDDQMLGATYQGTYMRLVVPAGRHRISGFAIDNGQIQLQTVPGQVYFINQTTWGYSSLQGSMFQLVDEKYGRSVVLSGTMSTEYIR